MRRLAWALGALLLVWALAWLALPPLVKAQAEKQLTARLGRTVSIGQVAIEPWALRLAIGDLKVAAAPGDADPSPQFELERLVLDVDARSLLRLAPVVEALQIQGPRLRLARSGEGRYDIDDMLRTLAPRPGETAGSPARFALYNLGVLEGALTFEDRPSKRRHRVEGLALTLPFLSSLPSHVEITVEPRLAFTLDGTRYDSAAQALPFAPDRNGALQLRVAGLDLAPYVGYLPESLPVRLKRGRVDADLAIAFAAPEGGTPTVSIKGTIAVQDLAVSERSGAALLDLAGLSLALRDVRPLVRTLDFGALRLQGLQVHVDRDARGRLGLERLQVAEAAPAQDAAVPAGAPPWQVSLASLEVTGGRVLWRDDAVQPASVWVLDAIDASAQELRWPATAAMPFSFKAVLRPQSDPSATLAQVSLQGEASTSAVRARLGIASLSIAAVAPYLNAAQRVRVAGSGNVDGQLEWRAGAAGAPMQLLLTLDEFAIAGLQVDEPLAGRATVRGETLAAQRVELRQVALDLGAQSVVVGSARLQRPDARLERKPDGIWNVMRLAGPTPLEESARPLVRAAAEATWQLRIVDFAVEGGRLSLVDALPAPGHAGPPTRLGVEALSLGLRDLRLRGERLVSTPQLQFSARVIDQTPGRARDQPGRIEWRGRFGLEPAQIAGKLQAERLPVDALQAYVAHPLGLRLERAEAGFRGEVSLRQDAARNLLVDLDGDVLLSDLKMVSVDRSGQGRIAAPDRELLNWQSFAINGLAVTLRPPSVPRVVVREAVLSDFFARLVLTEEGELNLRDVPPPRPGSAASAAAPAGAASAPSGRRVPLEFELGGMRLTHGRVDFSDRFVKPNYSAALTDLDGEVGAFRTGHGESASLRMSGRVAGTGLLEIAGRVKPNAVPRELDVRAKASEVELAPLSTYAGKYAGYAIERGKLSVEVRYKIEPDGRLEASHQLVLNQLTFGEPVQSPTATKLPVRLAVALLKDRNGVIDINLPVSGTLEDPQFSLGPIIWQVIGNLIAKAVTAPFALLAGAGGPDISSVAFAPGTARPTEEGSAVIDKVAKALEDRPALKMTVVGEAHLDREGEAFRQANVEQRLRQELRREQLRASGAAPRAADDAAQTPMTADERARAVKVVYRETDLPDKPRNLIGMKADIPAEEMEALLRANVRASPEAMRELALQRGLVVRDTLIAKGVPGDRLFVGDPRPQAGSGDDQAWTPRVKLTLDTR